MQVALAGVSDPDHSTRLRARETALLDTHGATWLGDRAGSRSDVTWRYGYIDRIATGDIEHLRQLLALPAGRLVRAVGFGYGASEAVAALAAARPPLLSEIDLGTWNPHHEPGEDEDDLGDLSTLWLHDRLEIALLTGAPQSFGTIVAPRLRHFEWQTLGPAPHQLAPLTQAQWPELTTLRLWFARGDGYNSKRAPWIRKLLTGDNLPKLAHLALHEYALWPLELRADLERSPLLPRLETLDLSAPLGAADSAGLAALRGRPAFAHLKRFEI